MGLIRHHVRGALAASIGATCLSLFMMATPAGAQTASPTANPAAITPPVISTYAGTGTPGYSGDGGPATAAKVSSPNGSIEDLLGNIYFADTANNRVRKVSAAGVISTVAGNGSYGFGGDGGPAKNAKLAAPTGVAVDPAGTLYIADNGNGRIRKVIADGMISTVAGNGSGFFHCGSGGNGGPATSAGLCLPSSVAFDAGNLYIADTGNNQVRKVAGGIIAAFAGTGAYGSSGNGGPATSALLASPTAVAVDVLHSVYIADTANNTVRKVTAGIIGAFAGAGHDGNAGGSNGDGGKCVDALLNHPTGLGIDTLGNVYIADTFDNAIRVCIPKGDMFTYAGTGAAGYSGDGGPATAAQLNCPAGNIAVDANNIFFGDTANNRVRKVHGGPPPNIPETPFTTALLPLSAFMLLGAGYLFHRRRPAAISTQ